MSFVWYFSLNYKAPYRSNDVQEACDLAYDYFSMLVDNFIAELPEHRQPLEFADWAAEEPTLAEKVHLIFPCGFGEFDLERNHNPSVWPWIVALSDSVREDNVQEYVNVLCQWWERRPGAGRLVTDQVQSLQDIFDYFTSYLQLFVTLADAESINLDFKYPPDWVRDTWTKVA